MPILKLTLIPIPICKNPRRKFDRIMRTLACTPSSSLSPSPPSSSQTLIGCIRRSTLAGGAGLGFYAAHVSPRRIKVSTFGSIFEKNNNREGEKKRILFSLSSFSSPFSSLSSSKEEEEREKSGGLVADMGHENSNDGVVLRPSGVVSSSKLLTLPTILTLGRVAAVPAFVATYYGNSWWATAATTSIFVAAAITDWLDGYLARKMRLGTAFGAFLDPVADKLMVAAALVLLCSKPPEIALFGDMPWLFPVPAIAIIGREITMSAVREWAASQNSKLLEAVAVNNLGKWKTATQMTALTILLAIRDSSLSGSETAVASGVTLLYISAGLAVWSLVVYMGKIWKVLLR